MTNAVNLAQIGSVQPGTAGNVLTSTGTGWTSAAGGGAPTPNVQTFDSTGTWTKPTGNYTQVRIQLWGGGQAAYYSNGIIGGAGGSYFEVTVPFAYVSTQTATVGGSGGSSTFVANGGTYTGYAGGSSFPYGDSGYFWRGANGGNSVCGCNPVGAASSTWGGGGGGSSLAPFARGFSQYGGNGGTGTGVQPGGGGGMDGSYRAGGAGRIIVTCS